MTAPEPRSTTPAQRLTEFSTRRAPLADLPDGTAEDKSPSSNTRRDLLNLYKFEAARLRRHHGIPKLKRPIDRAPPCAPGRETDFFECSCFGVSARATAPFFGSIEACDFFPHVLFRSDIHPNTCSNGRCLTKSKLAFVASHPNLVFNIVLTFRFIIYGRQCSDSSGKLVYFCEHYPNASIYARHYHAICARLQRCDQGRIFASRVNK